MANEESLGEIKINNEVISTVASLAALEVEGIVNLAGGARGSSIADIWSRKEGADRGITVEIGKDNTASLQVEANVEYGIDIYKAARQLQLAVKNAVESMTGLHVHRVNVTIRGIVLGERPRAAQTQSPGPAPVVPADASDAEATA